ncbi:MAG: TIGR03668 family PPOX class F420-dependent oxidoreductase [Chloroflexota bacterium]|nr:TIGR03668 family PPOX class F420-dependent oxidoreductase [Chloroflexota bacterium]
MTPDEARARVQNARVAYLATADIAGVPHIVPVTFVVDADRIITAIDGKPKRGTRLRRLDNIAANPAVSLLVESYDEDWSRLWWARADGAAAVLTKQEARASALELLRARYPQYTTVSIGGPVIVIEVRRWSGWTAGNLGH